MTGLHGPKEHKNHPKYSNKKKTYFSSDYSSFYTYNHWISTNGNREEFTDLTAKDGDGFPQGCTTWTMCLCTMVKKVGLKNQDGGFLK